VPLTCQDVQEDVNLHQDREQAVEELRTTGNSGRSGPDGSLVDVSPQQLFSEPWSTRVGRLGEDRPDRPAYVGSKPSRRSQERGVLRWMAPGRRRSAG
jgi:hypothetical protein